MRQLLERHEWPNGGIATYCNMYELVGPGGEPRSWMPGTLEAEGQCTAFPLSETARARLPRLQLSDMFEGARGEALVTAAPLLQERCIQNDTEFKVTGKPELPVARRVYQDEELASRVTQRQCVAAVAD